MRNELLCVNAKYALFYHYGAKYKHFCCKHTWYRQKHFMNDGMVRSTSMNVLCSCYEALFSDVVLLTWFYPQIKYRYCSPSCRRHCCVWWLVKTFSKGHFSGLPKTKTFWQKHFTAPVNDTVMFCYCPIHSCAVGHVQGKATRDEIVVFGNAFVVFTSCALWWWWTSRVRSMSQDVNSLCGGLQETQTVEL